MVTSVRLALPLTSNSRTRAPFMLTQTGRMPTMAAKRFVNLASVNL